MNKKECVLRELYDALQKLRYSEIAQIRFEEFENTILIGNKRIDLLHWLLQENSGFNTLSFNKLKGQTLDDKLTKCYSQIGLCTDQNILLGKCPIDKQLKFLSLLILFIRNVHIIDNEPTANHLKQEHVEIVMTNNDEIKTSLTNNNTESSSVTKDNIESSNHLKNEESYEKCSVDKLCSVLRADIKELQQQKIDYYTLVLQEFSIAFKEISRLPIQDSYYNIFTEFYDNLCSEVLKINSRFSVFDKIVINENKIKNQQILEYLDTIIKPLTPAIKQNLVLIEQACNMFKKNEIYI